MTTNKSTDILSMIRARQQNKGIKSAQEKDDSPEVQKQNEMGSPTTKDWKRFKETMIESVDGEPLKAGTGKTNKEFFKYLKEDVDDDQMATDDQLTLRRFLKNLDKD